MAISSIQLGLLGFILLVLFIQIRHWYRWRRLREWGKQFNCKEIYSDPDQIFWGLNRYGAIFYALLSGGLEGIDILDDAVLGKYKRLGKNTFRMYNPFNTSQVETAEPANIQAILASKFENFDLGEIRSANIFDLIGRGIFTAERDQWQHFRQQLRPQFSRGQISDIDSFERHIQILFKALPQEDVDGWITEVELMPYVYRHLTDTSTEFTLGQSLNSQTKFLHATDSGNASETKKDLEFIEAMQFAQHYILWRIRFGGMFRLARSKKFQKACQTVKEYADTFVARALDPDQKESIKAVGKDKYVFLDELIKETRDPIELRDQVLQLLFAGRDTTSSVLSFVFLLLARHPFEFDTLRESVISTFGSDASPRTPITFESLRSCKAIMNVIYETLRLYPVVPINSRVANRDTILPAGGGSDGKSPIVIKKGEQVGFCAYVIHRREDLWGSDAADWKPGRWAERKLGWDFIGFGGGPRACIGQQYALTEAAFVIVKMLQRFDRVEALGHTKRKIPKDLSITLKPGPGQTIRLHRATG